MKALLVLVVTILASSCNSNQKTRVNNNDAIKEGNNSKKMNGTPDTLMKTWDEFCQFIQIKDYEKIKRMSCDSLIIEGETVSSNTFLQTGLGNFFNDDFLAAAKEPKKLEFIRSEIYCSDLENKSAMREDGKCYKYILNVTLKNSFPPLIKVVEFLKTSEGFKFWSCYKVSG